MAPVSNFLFFKKNFFDIDTTFTSDFATTNEDEASKLFDNDRDTILQTSGSSGDVTDRWSFTFPSNITIDAIHLDNLNIKTGEMEYWNGSIFTQLFAINNTSLDETVYETFSSVTTDRFRLTMTSSFDASEYFVGQLRFLEIVGQLECNPQNYTPQYKEAANDFITSTGQNVHVLFHERYGAMLDFIPAFDNDVSLLRTLKELREPFTVFPNGGEEQTEIGFRLRDIFTVNYTNAFNSKPRNNLLGVGEDISVVLQEAG